MWKVLFNCRTFLLASIECTGSLLFRVSEWVWVVSLSRTPAALQNWACACRLPSHPASRVVQLLYIVWGLNTTQAQHSNRCTDKPSGDVTVVLRTNGEGGLFCPMPRWQFQRWTMPQNNPKKSQNSLSGPLPQVVGFPGDANLFVLGSHVSFQIIKCPPKRPIACLTQYWLACWNISNTSFAKNTSDVSWCKSSSTAYCLVYLYSDLVFWWLGFLQRRYLFNSAPVNFQLI